MFNNEKDISFVSEKVKYLYFSFLFSKNLNPMNFVKSKQTETLVYVLEFKKNLGIRLLFFK